MPIFLFDILLQGQMEIMSAKRSTILVSSHSSLQAVGECRSERAGIALSERSLIP